MFVRTKDVLAEIEYELNRALVNSIILKSLLIVLVSVLFFVLKSGVKIEALSYPQYPLQSLPGLQCLYIWSDKKK